MINSILYHLMALIKNRAIIVGGWEKEKSPAGAFGGLAGDFFISGKWGGLEPFDFFEYEEGGA